MHDEAISSSLFHLEQMPEKDKLEGMITQRSDVKVDEVREACRMVGVTNVFLLGADDAVLLATEAAVRSLARLLHQISPDIVLTHFPKDGDGRTNPHAVAGQIVMLAITCAGSVEPGDRNPPVRPAQVFFYGTGAAHIRHNLWEAQGGYYNDVFIDINDVVEKKLAPLDCLVSQGYDGAYAHKRIETTNGAFGAKGQCSYAEGFTSLNAQTHYYLPLTEHALAVARSSDSENIACITHRIKVD